MDRAFPRFFTASVQCRWKTHVRQTMTEDPCNALYILAKAARSYGFAPLNRNVSHKSKTDGLATNIKCSCSPSFLINLKLPKSRRNKRFGFQSGSTVAAQQRSN